MEGVTRTAFRILSRRRGASLVTTDMIDADTFCGIADVRGVAIAIQEQINPHIDEGPLAIQLGGGNRETLVRAVHLLEPYATLIDLNAGCPTGKTFENGGGCTLMRDPERLYAIVKELRDATTKPFTVKLRKGWDSPQAIDIAQAIEALGVDGITIHPRTREQRYSDRADWVYARAVKEHVRIPVTLSGDVVSASSAKRALEETGCDFLMIGRAARANPSIFADLVAGVDLGKRGERPVSDFVEWLELVSATGRLRFSEIRERAIWTVSGAKNAKALKRAVNHVRSEDELLVIVRHARFPEAS